MGMLFGKEYDKTAKKIVKGGVILGVGATVVSAASGSTAPLGTVAGFVPVATTATMGFLTVRALQHFDKSTKKHRKIKGLGKRINLENIY